jgi:hypothetical protein
MPPLILMLDVVVLFVVFGTRTVSPSDRPLTISI